jgi:ribosomal protein L11 methyltransferase
MAHWRRVRILAGAEAAQRLSEALLEAGAVCVDVSDARAGTPEEQPLFGEPGATTPGAWLDSEVAALFPADSDALGVSRRACADCGVDAEPREDAVPDQDWVRLTREQFAPLQASPRLWIVPTWCEPPDPRALNLRLDPGLAFGTGSHPTTGLCLEWLDLHLPPGASVIDYGCGSGVLAIAACLLGASDVRGVDIDPAAVSASRANAAANGVEACFCGPDELDAPPAQVVVANILANPLRVLAPLLSNLSMPGGSVVLSGVLETQSEEVVRAYAPWFDFEPSRARDGWVRLWGRRRP